MSKHDAPSGALARCPTRPAVAAAQAFARIRAAVRASICLSGFWSRMGDPGVAEAHARDRREGPTRRRRRSGSDMVLDTAGGACRGWALGHPETIGLRCLTRSSSWTPVTRCSVRVWLWNSCPTDASHERLGRRRSGRLLPTEPMSRGRSPSQISHAHHEYRPPHVRAPRADLPGHLPRR
jgi:hypothetical protein